MTETINIAIDSEELKEFKETTGMSLMECIKILRNSVKYGGKLEFDEFWNEANVQHIKKSIREMDEGKVVKFTEEEWEKYVNAQEINGDK